MKPFYYSPVIKLRPDCRFSRIDDDRLTNVDARFYLDPVRASSSSRYFLHGFSIFTTMTFSIPAKVAIELPELSSLAHRNYSHDSRGSIICASISSAVG